MDINYKQITLDRVRNNMTAKELSKKAGVGIHTVTKLENGKGKARLLTVSKIARALDKEIEDYIIN